MRVLYSPLRKWLLSDCRQACLQRRLFATQRNPGRFDILFLGRDEFSVAVLDQLNASRGAFESWYFLKLLIHL